MVGRKGRSGGHNKLSLEEHRLRGTFNVTRHGPRAVAALSARAVPSMATAALPEEFGGLVGSGLEFAEQMWGAYAGWAPTTTTLLRECGYLLDELDHLRGTKEGLSRRRLLLAYLGQLNANLER